MIQNLISEYSITITDFIPIKRLFINNDFDRLSKSTKNETDHKIIAEKYVNKGHRNSNIFKELAIRIKLKKPIVINYPQHQQHRHYLINGIVEPSSQFDDKLIFNEIDVSFTHNHSISHQSLVHQYLVPKYQDDSDALKIYASKLSTDPFKESIRLSLDHPSNALIPLSDNVLIQLESSFHCVNIQNWLFNHRLCVPLINQNILKILFFPFIHKPDLSTHDRYSSTIKNIHEVLKNKHEVASYLLQKSIHAEFLSFVDIRTMTNTDLVDPTLRNLPFLRSPQHTI